MINFVLFLNFNNRCGTYLRIDGVPDKNNFNKYRMLRHREAPKTIDVHFVKNDIDPTGMSEPTVPPTFGALANALYKAKGKRLYNQQFVSELSEDIRGL